MSVEDWKFELQRLFETFERESTISLRKINRCFELLGRPFSDEFRRYFLKMSILRLDSSFHAILMERNFDDQMQMPSTSNAHTVTNDIAAEVNTLNSTVHIAVAPSMTQNGSLVELKIENYDDHEVPIEIYDSNDEEVVENEQTQATNDTVEEQMVSNTTPELMSDIQNPSDGPNDIDSIKENGVEDHVKRELKVEIVDEVMDLPLIVFDPNNVDESLSAANGGNNVAQQPCDDNQPSSSSITSKPPENGVVSRFKCDRCAYATRYKHNLKSHQLIHAANVVKPFKCEKCTYATRYKPHFKRHQMIHIDQNLLGIARDAKDGLFQCTQCDQQFSRWQSLKLHLASTHKNNQRLFNCGHCMRRFTRKNEKDGHEAHCRVRLYECYLCKMYVARAVSTMQRHMRTHSGARPFKCAICNKCFGLKQNLKCHLNVIHNRIDK